LVGAVGVLTAPIAGRIADNHGPRAMIALGAIHALVAWAVFGLWSSIAGLVVGVILLDFGVQSALISNQHIVYALRPEARARLNTIFMGAMFLGGAAGSAAATQLWSWGGWISVSALGGGLAAIATGLQLASRNRKA
jgi:predicted MFS family arabinose efflux permease